MEYQKNETSYQNYEQITLPKDPQSARLHVGIIAFAAALVIILANVAQMFAYWLIAENYPAFFESEWFSWTLSGLPIYLVGMPIAYLLLLTVPASAPKKQKTNPLMWVGFLCLCFTITYVVNYLGQYAASWFTRRTNIEVDNELAEMTSVAPLIVNFVFVGILPPIFEELFYRKAIVNRLRRYGDLPAILISGLIFGLTHGNFSQIFYATFAGMLLSFIYIKTGSILYTISLHSAFNIIGGVYTAEVVRRIGSDLIPADGDTIGMTMILMYGAFVILALIIGTVFFVCNVRRFKRSLQKGEYTLSFDKWMNAIVINPGTWVFLVVVILMVVANLFT